MGGDKPALIAVIVLELIAVIVLAILLILAAYHFHTLTRELQELQEGEEEAVVSNCQMSNYRMATVKLTAYSASKEETDGSPELNAQMRKVKPGDIAVSRSLFLRGWVFGRKVYIYQYGVYEINDLMAPRIEGDCIDVYFPQKKDAKEFGVKENVIAVLLPEKTE